MNHYPGYTPVMDPLLEPRNDLTDLPSPGEIVIYDYTQVRNDLNDSHEDSVIKAVQWNIERAYKLDEIIELLAEESTDRKDHRPSYKSKVTRNPRGNPCFSEEGLRYRDFDVMAIQEFDINCARSNHRNSPQELARALKMRCIFLCEFEEIFSAKLRNKRTQGGGVHGNGILTWWDVERVEVIDHVEIFDWEHDGDKLSEPRKGARRSLACFLRHPRDPQRKMLVYSVHLEVFCGIFGRLRQFSQILAHSRANIATHPHQMILGDLNTMAHGLARFLPKYCCDGMRWRSVGWSESEWWQRNLFKVTPIVAGEGPEDFNYFLAAHHHPKKPRSGQFEQEIEAELDSNANEASCEVSCDKCTLQTSDSSTSTPVVSTSIFTKQELKNLINPFFFCPFPVSRSKTVEMHGYSGKLDWMLLRGWRVRRFGLDNEIYARSDHKLLWCEVEYFRSEAGDVGREAHDFYYQSIAVKQPENSKSPFFLHRRNILIGVGLLGVASSLLLYYVVKK